MATYPRYESYKATDVEWIKQVPTDWEVLRIQDFSTVNEDVVREYDYRNRQIRYVDISGVEAASNTYTFEVQGFNDAPSRARRLTKAGDTVFSTVRPYLKAVATIHEPEEDLVFSTGFAVIRPKCNADSRFVGYVLRNDRFINEVSARSVGASYPAINAPDLVKLHVSLPPLPEQCAIAAFLDAKCAAIDEAVRIKQAQIALLRERRQILIQQAVTRGLTNLPGANWNAAGGPQGEGMDSPSSPDAPLKDSGIDWIGQIPAHWEVRRSKFLFTQRKELAKRGDIQLSATQSYGVIPQEQFEELVGRRVVKISTNLDKRKHVEPNDFVISMRSFQGGLERAHATGCIRSSYVILRPTPEVNPEFFGYLLKTPRYIHALQITGNFIRDGQDLTFENFANVDLYIPPYHEQARIAEYIKCGCEAIDNAITLKQSQITTLKEYKTVLINAAVTGKIKVA